MLIIAGRLAFLLLSLVSVAGLIYAVTVLVNAQGPRDWAVVVLLTAMAFPWQILLGIAQGSILHRTLRRVQAAPHSGHDLQSLVVAWSHLFDLIDWLPVFAAGWLALKRHRSHSATP